jgi:hypothetical protein
MSPETRPFRNSNLFSNHYLESLVMDSAQWREAKPEEAFARIRELYQRKARVLENYNESQLEENFIRPVLRILGHYFGGSQEKQEETGHRSSQTGARTGAAGGVRGVDGQACALEGADQADGRVDRCDGVQAVRAHGRGDRDCGREGKLRKS